MAFTLIEIAFSLAIVAFALTAIIGLVPIGLSGARAAVESTVSANILAAAMNDLRQREFSKIEALEASGPSLLWFDDQGFAVPDANKADAIYEVRVEIADGQLPRASGASPAATGDLKTIVLRIVHNPGGVRRNIPEAEYTRFTAYVSRIEARGAA